MLTFSLGAGLAGLSGALLAPTTSIMPFMGQQFVAPAFITVVVGGATNVIAGAVGSSLLLSLVRHADRLSVRRLPRPRRAAACRARHHPADAGRHLGLAAAAGSTGAPRSPDHARSGDFSTGPRGHRPRPSVSGSASSALIGVPLLLPAAHQRVRRRPISPSICSTSRWRSGLCLLWGYCGVLSFGQVAYFGIAGYLYGIIAGNLIGNPWGPLIGSVGGLAACAVVAAIFGYFVFYARVQMWIAPILTLVFTLAARDFPRPDCRLPVARRHGAARRLQRHDRHPVVPARRPGLLRLSRSTTTS